MKYAISLAVLMTAAACSENKSPNLQSESDPKNTAEKMEKYANDSHSFSEPNKVATTHLNLNVAVDFETHIISGTATYDLDRVTGNTLQLDNRNLKIEKVTSLPDNENLDFKIALGNVLGNGLIITLND